MSANGAVINLDAYRAASYIADEFKRRFATEIAEARRCGVKLRYVLETEEQIGRGTLHVARVRIYPNAEGPRRKFHSMGQECIEGRADYIEPPDAFDAIAAALKEAWTLGKDSMVF